MEEKYKIHDLTHKSIKVSMNPSVERDNKNRFIWSLKHGINKFDLLHISRTPFRVDLTILSQQDLCYLSNTDKKTLSFDTDKYLYCYFECGFQEDIFTIDHKRLWIINHRRKLGIIKTTKLRDNKLIF